MTWPHRGKVQLAFDNTHLADLRMFPMPRAEYALLVQSFHHQRQNDRLISVRDFALTEWWSAARNGAGVGVGAQLRLPSSAVCI